MNKIMEAFKSIDKKAVAKSAGKIAQVVGLCATVVGGACDLITHDDDVKEIFCNLKNFGKKS